MKARRPSLPRIFMTLAVLFWLTLITQNSQAQLERRLRA